jgi:hypothetical protein
MLGKFPADPRPGQPFPLSLDTERLIPEATLQAGAAQLRQLLRWNDG